MSERVSEVQPMAQPMTPPAHRPAGRRAWARGPVLFAVAVVATYALVGLGAGWVWHELWHPAEGVVVEHGWHPDGTALREDFSGTGLYVLIAAGAGLVLGLLFAILGGVRPVVTLVACVVGSLLAGWLMLRLGERLGPADPQVLAANAEDGTRLPSALRVSGPSPLFAFSLGTLAALALVFTVFQGKTPEHEFGKGPRG
jgi:hypothetical protein